MAGSDEDTASLLARLEREASAPDVISPYGPGPDQFGALRLPVADDAGAGPYPVVIGIHGGYWRARYDLTYLGAAMAALTRAGLATWNIEYHRTTAESAGWPDTFLDVGAAADHLRVLARDYPLDLRRVVALGHSAGGQLALWLAARPLQPPTGASLWRPDALALAGAISLAGVVDLARAWDLGLSDNAAAALMGGSPADYPDRYREASPRARLPLGVRQVLLHGDLDTNVPIALSAEYAAAARRLGDPVEYEALPGVGHFELVDPATPAWRGVERAALSLVGAR